MDLEQYSEFTRPHQRFLRQIVLDFQFFVEDLRLQGVFSTEARVKEYGSATAKAAALTIPIEELQDIAGIRVVVASPHDVPLVLRFFERRAEISKDFKIHTTDRISRPAGYRSTHLIGEFDGHHSRSMRPGKVEVQVPTILEHAFNFVSRTLVYKSSAKHNSEWKAEFKALSSQLAALDEVAGRLQSTAHDEAKLKPHHEPLTPYVYQRVLREEFGETCDARDAVDSTSWYSQLGVKTMDQLQSFFRNPQIVELWDEFHLVLNETSKSSFWSMFGTRLDKAREILEALKRSSETKGSSQET